MRSLPACPAAVCWKGAAMMTADEIRFLFSEYEIALSAEIAIASGRRESSVCEVIGRFAANLRDGNEAKVRGRNTDQDLIRIMRKRVAERRERLEA